MMNAVPVSAENLSWRPNGPGFSLRDVNFKLAAGKMLAVAGPNGAGKSTLLRILYRYRRPSTGKVWIGEDDLWRLKPKQAARRVAAVPQESPAGFSMTAREIVSLGRTPHRKGISKLAPEDSNAVDRAMEKIGVENFANKNFDSLSGGEKQSVMIARALAQEPALLILDEPTNHLDIRRKLEILTLLRDAGPTIICSMHDLPLAAEYADEVLVLSHGEMLASGPMAETLSEELIETAFSVAARIERIRERTVYTFNLPKKARRVL